MDEDRVSKELSRVYIKQIDYTQDLLGFFVSVDIFNDIKYLAKTIDFKPS